MSSLFRKLKGSRLQDGRFFLKKPKTTIPIIARITIAMIPTNALNQSSWICLLSSAFDFT